MFQEYYIKNNNFKNPTVTKLESSRYVNVKDLPEGLRSINFSRECFTKNAFDELTVKARGLFLYEDGTVAARSYDKFFNVYFDKEKNGEADFQDCHIDAVKENIKFPVSVYKKYNGYLGLLSWNHNTNNWLIATKSETRYDFAEWFRKILTDMNLLTDSLKEYLKNNNVTLIFEVIDIENDPHIIYYDHSFVVLLDVVSNDLENASFIPYEELKKFAHENEFECKELVTTLNTFTQLKDFLKSYDNKDSEQIEGFVITDSNNYRIKFKTGFYCYWKSARYVLNNVLNGTNVSEKFINKTGTQEVYDFLKSCKPEDIENITNVIQLRNIMKNFS